MVQQARELEQVREPASMGRATGLLKAPARRTSHIRPRQTTGRAHTRRETAFLEW
jgi:hypothetical protein